MLCKKYQNFSKSFKKEKILVYCLPIIAEKYKG